MTRLWAVIRREYLEIVRTRMFLIGTLLGPALLLALLLVPSVLLDDEGGTSRVAILDATGEGFGERVVVALRDRVRAPGARATRFESEVIEMRPERLAAVAGSLAVRVRAEDLDGVLELPPDLVAGGGTVRYEGRDATNRRRTRTIRGAVERVVQVERLAREGIDPTAVGAALERVPFVARKAGAGAVSGSPVPALLLAVLITLGGWFTLVNSGNSVIRGVREERRDKVVEVVLSSIPARTLILGKILGNWAAASSQGAAWVLLGAGGVRFGDRLLERFGGDPQWIPQVPPSLGIVIVVFFAGGYFLFASLSALLTSLALSDQEASQIPTLVQWLPLPVWLLIGRVLNDPEGILAVLGSFVPIFAPILMPTRASLAPVPLLELALSAALLYLTGWFFAALAAKIYRITIMAAGTRLTPRLVLRWLRTA